MIKHLIFGNLIPRNNLYRIVVGNILLLIAFSLIYYIMFVYNKKNHFFIPEYESHSYINALYFSLVTQSTLGYGDIYPTSNLSKSIVMIHVFIMLILVML